MQNFCQIYAEKTKKISALLLILCFIFGLTPDAEGISAKLRGKIALGLILSGVAYTTHALIKHDKLVAEELRHHLGVPERVVQFERGFDFWRIEHYADRHYIFRNNRLLTKTNFSISEVPRGSAAGRGWQTGSLEGLGWKNGRMEDWVPIFPLFHASIPVSSIFFPVFTDMPVSGSPKWSRLYLLDSLQVPQLVSSDLHRSATERSLDPRWSLSH